MSPESHLHLPRAVGLYQGTPKTKAIKTLFRKARADLKATSLAKQVVRELRTVGPTSIRYSLWFGRYDREPTWLEGSGQVEKRMAFILVLEHDGMTGIVSVGAGSVASRLGLKKASHGTVTGIHAANATGILGLSMRTMGVAASGVRTRSVAGTDLEGSFSRLSAKRAIPNSLKFGVGGAAWRVSSGSGKVSELGGRVQLDGLCLWFVGLIRVARASVAPTTGLLGAFASPLEVPLKSLTPTALQFDPGCLLRPLEEGGVCRLADGSAPTTEQLNLIQARLETIWNVCSPTPARTKWTLADAAGTPWGHVRVSNRGYRIEASDLASIEVVGATGEAESLLKRVNRTAAFLISYDDPCISFYGANVFRDAGIVPAARTLLDFVDGSMPAASKSWQEKTPNGASWDSNCIFGFVQDRADANGELIVCDDMGTEWADFIGIDTINRRVTFYHCKKGETDLGASNLHDVVSQATKNIGMLRASSTQIQDRVSKWEAAWSNEGAAVDRVSSGTAQEFADELEGCIASHITDYRVVLVTSALKRQKLSDAVDALEAGGAITAPGSHVIWLLSAFADVCTAVGIKPGVLCR